MGIHCYGIAKEELNSHISPLAIFPMKSNSFRDGSCLAVLLSISILISGCQSESSDFKKAQEDHSIESYQLFLDTHPEGEFASQAQQYMCELEFNKVTSIGTIESYKVFLAKYPEGKFAQKVESLLEDAYLKEATVTNTKESYLFFLDLYPESKYNSLVESKYVSIRILEMYKHASKDPIGDYETRFKEYVESGDIGVLERLTKRNMAEMSAFNKYAGDAVKSDEYLSNYFNKLIPMLESEEDPSIENLNYWGLNVRSAIEEDLGVDIYDSRD